ncbi:MAG: efflux RND transporter periplasmic adaptor subunit [Verrucomicrobiota bacterium]
MKRPLISPDRLSWPVLYRLVPVAVLLLAAAGCKPALPASNATPTVPVQVAVAAKLDMPRRFDSIGTVQALRSVGVKSQVDGVLAAVHFKEGDDVKAGDLLVTLDRRPLENSLRITRADLANARAAAAQAEADATRAKALDQSKAVSQEELTQILSKAEMAQAQVQAREAAVANAELQLGYTEIRAPIAGRTGQLMLHEGALVKANDAGSSIVAINQLAPVAVAYAVPENALDEIRAALAAQRTTVAVNDRATGLARTGGRLEFVDNTVDPATGMITLKATFPNEDHALWPGRFVRIATQVGVDRDAIVVPSPAVQTSQNGSTIYVLKADQTVDLRPVKVARVAGDQTLIASGLAAGETVVTDGQLRLVPGAKAVAKTLSPPPPAANAR